MEANRGLLFYQLGPFKSNPFFHPCGESPNQKKKSGKQEMEEFATEVEAMTAGAE